MFRQGALFSYIIVEIVWLCEFLFIAEVLSLTVGSGPLGFSGCRVVLMPPGPITK
jgi:hypothetical protein